MDYSSELRRRLRGALSAGFAVFAVDPDAGFTGSAVAGEALGGTGGVGGTGATGFTGA
jgi:hypothetical protein